MSIAYKEKAGQEGEKITKSILEEKIAIPYSGECIVLHNVKLTFEYKYGKKYNAQIDHMIITSKKIFLIDSKHWNGNITFMLNEVIQEIKDEKTGVINTYTYPSPDDVESQMRHHEYVIKQILHKESIEVDVEAFASFTNRSCNLVNQPLIYKALYSKNVPALIEDHLRQENFSSTQSISKIFELISKYISNDVKLNNFDQQFYFRPKISSNEFVELRLSNGLVYKGQWNDKRKFEGIGLLRTSNGEFYRGQFKDGNFNGFGEYISEYFSYKGYWLNSLRHGSGTCIYPFNSSELPSNIISIGRNDMDGIYPESYFKCCKFEYAGDWQNGVKQGKGQLFLIDRANSRKLCFEGEWENNQRHGLGRENFLEYEAENIKYVDEVSGIDYSGIYEGINQEGFYKGEWKYNVKEGNAEWNFSDNPIRIYKGKWANNRVLKEESFYDEW
jgi:hypothetical protein